MQTGLRALRKFAGWALLASGLLLAATMLVPAIFGYERYVITSSSMEGSYDRGSLVYAEKVPTYELDVGDVITYVPPKGESADSRVTHRIFAIDHEGWNTVYTTKGDANATPDPWRFELDQWSQARAVHEVPYVGYAFGALGMKPVRMLVIGLPAALIAFFMLAGLWREAGEEAARARESAAVSA